MRPTRRSNRQHRSQRVLFARSHLRRRSPVQFGPLDVSRHQKVAHEEGNWFSAFTAAFNFDLFNRDETISYERAHCARAILRRSRSRQ